MRYEYWINSKSSTFQFTNTILVTLGKNIEGMAINVVWIKRLELNP